MARPISKSGAYARELGITTQQLRMIGGLDRAKAMSPAARRLLMTKKRHT